MKTFCEIAKGLYIKTSDIKYVASLERKNLSCERLRRNASLNNKLVYSPCKKTSKCFIATTDDTIYYTNYSGDTVAEKLRECGKQLLKVDTDIYISVQHIKAVYDSQTCKSVFRGKLEDTVVGDLQFLRKRESIQTEILMTTGEKVRLSKLSTDIVNEVDL